MFTRIPATLNSYKAKAGRIADAMTRTTLPPITPDMAAQEVLAGRMNNGPRAAVMLGLLTGALIERGHPDLAKEIIERIVMRPDFIMGRKT